MPDFQIVADIKPTGDQPNAIEELVDGLDDGERTQTLLGVTGSGKTFTMAERHRAGPAPDPRPCPQQDAGGAALLRVQGVLSRTTRSSISSPTTTTTSPRRMSPAPTPTSRRNADINEEIDKLRHAATRSLLTRQRHADRRVGLLHLRSRFARGISEHRRLAPARRADLAATRSCAT